MSLKVSEFRYLFHHQIEKLAPLLLMEDQLVLLNVLGKTTPLIFGERLEILVHVLDRSVICGHRWSWSHVVPCSENQIDQIKKFLVGFLDLDLFEGDTIRVKKVVDSERIGVECFRKWFFNDHWTRPIPHIKNDVSPTDATLDMTKRMQHWTHLENGLATDGVHVLSCVLCSSFCYN